MEIFNEARHATSRSTVIKCCLKNQCLPELHKQRCTEILLDILITSPFSVSDLETVTLNSKIRNIERDFNIFQSLGITQTPESLILKEASIINNTVSLDQVANSRALSGNEPSRSEFSNSILPETFDSRVQSDEERTNDY